MGTKQGGFMLRLVSVAGPFKGMSWVLESAPLVIGRAPECAISLPDPIVSRHHCEIQAVDGRAAVRDFGGANTTLVNSLPIESDSLEVGDEIMVGDSVFLLVREGGAPLEIPPALADGETVSLVEEDAYYIQGDFESLNQRTRPATISDLAHLFQLGRELGSTRAVGQMFETVAEEAVRRLDAGALWITRVSRSGEHAIVFTQTYQDSLEHHALPLELLSNSAHKRGIATSVDVRNAQDLAPEPYAYLVAPIIAQETCIGTIAVLKPLEGDEYAELNYLVAMAFSLAPNILSAEHVEQQERDIAALREGSEPRQSLVGKSPMVSAIRELVEKIGPSDLSVLITGETGVGKEVVARMLHGASRRKDNRFVAVNCPAIPEHLFESELFGHVEGSFTGAASTRLGLIEEANHGTLFLDEVSELSPGLQAKLLRVLEDGGYRRVGENTDRQVDVRVLSATNSLTETSLSEVGFRADLYHRLCGLELKIGPLRDRQEDVLPLAERFLEEYARTNDQGIKKISKLSAERLLAHSWPGNVRELRQVIGRAYILSLGSNIEPDALRLDGNVPSASAPESSHRELSEVERDHIFRVLEDVGWVRKDAAQILGIDRDTLRRKIRLYDIKASVRA